MRPASQANPAFADEIFLTFSEQYDHSSNKLFEARCSAKGLTVPVSAFFFQRPGICQ